MKVLTKTRHHLISYHAIKTLKFCCFENTLGAILRCDWEAIEILDEMRFRDDISIRMILWDLFYCRDQNLDQREQVRGIPKAWLHTLWVQHSVWCLNHHSSMFLPFARLIFICRYITALRAAVQRVGRVRTCYYVKAPTLAGIFIWFATWEIWDANFEWYLDAIQVCSLFPRTLEHARSLSKVLLVLLVAASHFFIFSIMICRGTNVDIYAEEPNVDISVIFMNLFPALSLVLGQKNQMQNNDQNKT